MNTQIADSGTHIDKLTATLSSTRFENKRLMTLASRAAELETQLTAMESRQSRLQEELTNSQEDERSAIQRWKHAESRLRELNDQIQRIEREARSEREKHVEMYGRMQRDRVAEKELKSAAGRLKGAAAADMLGRDKSGTNIINHFVRDILQDNANLQAGVTELRELLQTSNEEVQNLREQVLRHQPRPSEPDLQPASLMDEIQKCRPKAVSQEIHVHHHYHPKIATKNQKTPSFRRPLRRRGLVSSSSKSPGECQTPTPHCSSHIVSTPYSENRLQRWPTQSSATGFTNISSLPSSPRSDNRSSSIFERIDSGVESSRPTSPESARFASSHFQFERRKAQSQSNIVGLTGVSKDEPSSIKTGLSEPRQRARIRQPVSILHKDATLEQGTSCKDIDSPVPSAQCKHPTSGQDRPKLDHEWEKAHVDQHASPLDDLHLNRPAPRRSSSRESLVSISGMDIHLPQHQNPRLYRRPKPSSTLEASDPLIFSIAFASSQPLASIVEVNASSSNLASPSTSDSLSPVSLLSGLAGGKSPQPGAQGLGRLVGSWVRGRWGITPTSSTGNLLEEAASIQPFSRVPGINQKGPIVGWRPPSRTPSEVHAKVLDQGLLKESLAE